MIYKKAPMWCFFDICVIVAKEEFEMKHTVYTVMQVAAFAFLGSLVTFFVVLFFPILFFRLIMSEDKR